MKRGGVHAGADQAGAGKEPMGAMCAVQVLDAACTKKKLAQKAVSSPT